MINKKYLKHASGLSCWICAVLAIIGLWTMNSFGQTTTIITTSGSFVVPAGVTSIDVYTFGGGGGGGGGYSSCASQGNGGGGGGGGMAKTTFAVTPGQSYTATVGAAGTAGAYSATGGTGGTTT